MHYAGIDLAKRSLVVCVEEEGGRRIASQSFLCSQETEIVSFFQTLRPFQAVIEASTSYRWLYDRLSLLGEVILAHPLQLRAIVAGRAKTDKLDAARLARLLRAGRIPRAYVPPKPYQELRDLARARAALARKLAQAKNEMHLWLWKANVHLPYRNLRGNRAQVWIHRQDLGGVGNRMREERFSRMEHFEKELLDLDRALKARSAQFPQAEALTCL